ncbi:MAG: hypothetical protein WBY47_05110 [Desulfobacterales bacterium]|jgi:hypothetical protein
MDPENIIQNNGAHPRAIKIVLLGALSFLLAGPVTGIPAILMGHREMSKYRKNTEIYLDADRRIIIGGMILGYIGIILTSYLIVLGLAAYFGWDLRELINVST